MPISIFHITSFISPHYLVKHKVVKFHIVSEKNCEKFILSELLSI